MSSPDFAGPVFMGSGRAPMARPGMTREVPSAMEGLSCSE